MADCRQVLFDGRRGQLAGFVFDPRGNVQRLHVDDRRHASRNRAPIAKFRHGSDIGMPRVRVEDIRSEEFQKAKLCSITGGGD
jgi:hypothetical protein